MRFAFEVVRTRRTARSKCPTCGATRTRSKQFAQTVNPFNLDADGHPKNRDQVRVDVESEADSWIPDFRCTTHAAEATS